MDIQSKSDKYINYTELKKLSKLKIEDIKQSKIPKCYKLLFYVFYNYYKELDNICIKFNEIIKHIIHMNKLKALKYFEARGFDFKDKMYYSYAIINNSYKLFPYFESLGFNLKTTFPFNNLLFFHCDLKLSI
jgi:hypothetical protein